MSFIAESDADSASAIFSNVASISDELGATRDESDSWTMDSEGVDDDDDEDDDEEEEDEEGVGLESAICFHLTHTHTTTQIAIRMSLIRIEKRYLL